MLGHILAHEQQQLGEDLVPTTKTLGGAQDAMRRPLRAINKDFSKREPAAKTVWFVSWFMTVALCKHELGIRPMLSRNSCRV